MPRPIALLLLCSALAASAAAQTIELPKPLSDQAALPETIRTVAERALAAYSEPDRAKYLDNLFRLQIATGRYDEALKSLAELHEVANVRWEVYARAKQSGGAFDTAFRAAFRDAMSRLDDKTAYAVLWTFGTSPVALQNGFRDAVTKAKDATSLPLAGAIDLVRKSLSATAFGEFGAMIDALTSEDDARRYITENDIAVKTPEGATICASVVRPRKASKLPALLEFSIYADPVTTPSEIRRSAANGYAGVLGLTRGKGCSPDTPVPYEHDAADAAAVVDWIAAQSWSDGRVGMYGGSYSGFTTWAAAKKMPKALKGIMNGAPVGPGLDVPMEGNVFWNFVYPWTFYTTNNKTLDDATYSDAARWQRLDREYYVSGRAYRDLEKIDGTPNPIFPRWISHPAYDAYWRSMIPFGDEFARIGIPVLTTAGYYFGGPGASTYYFREHTSHRPDAEHYLLIGPYDHVRGHRGTMNIVGGKMTSLFGYDIEPVAQIDMGELRYQWFDYVFHRGPRPALLEDRVNYEVMGANVWKHAPSIAAMSNHTVRFYLASKETLSSSKPAAGSSIPLTVDFRHRSDADRPTAGGGIIDTAVDVSNGLKFVSEPIATPTDISGAFSGRLDFIADKKDFDFIVTLYELTADGHYVLLAPYWSRASYSGHGSVRRLLTPGSRKRIDFTSMRLIGRSVQPGSRVVAVVQVLKQVGMQINYGSRKEVSSETMADAKSPLKIRWLAGSYIDVPVRR